MKIYLVLIVFLLIITYNAEAVIINEIMPNPIDEGNEWIEIYNPENVQINLSLWGIADNAETDEITCYTIENCSFETNETYILIIARNANISEIINESKTYFYVDDSKIGNYLNNGGDNISIYNSTELLDNVSYPSFEYNEGYSWVRMDNGSWSYCDSPTPGLPNICDQGETNETNTTNNTCNLYLWIRCDDIFFMGSNKYRLMVEDLEGGNHKPEVEYWIEDMFGNVVRKKRRTNNTNSDKSWTPDEITGTEAYIIHAMITNQVCNDTNISNNVAERMVVVKGDEQSSNSDCSCETKIIEKEKSCSCGPCPKCKEEGKEFEINSYPKEVRKDEEIEIEIKIENPSVHRRKYTVYSYIYEEKKPLSLGFDGDKWLNTWDANKQNVSLDGNSSVTFTLKNRIANDTEPGEYKLRVRIWVEGEKHDITEEISVKETPRQTVEDENKTEVEETEILDDEPEFKTKIPTGRVISERNDNWFSQLVNNVINFFKNLFNV